MQAGDQVKVNDGVATYGGQAGYIVRSNTAGDTPTHVVALDKRPGKNQGDPDIAGDTVQFTETELTFLGGASGR
jgi:hypothetical protein